MSDLENALTYTFMDAKQLVGGSRLYALVGTDTAAAWGAGDCPAAAGKLLSSPPFFLYHCTSLSRVVEYRIKKI